MSCFFDKYCFVSVAIHTKCRVSSTILQTISNWSVQKNVAAKMFILSTHYNALLLMVCNTGQNVDQSKFVCFQKSEVLKLLPFVVLLKRPGYIFTSCYVMPASSIWTYLRTSPMDHRILIFACHINQSVCTHMC